MTPMMIIYFCQGWTGWLYVTWMPSLLKNNYGLDLKKSSLLYAAVILAGFIAELLGGVSTDYLLRLTLQLHSTFQVRAPGGGLMGASPE
jgi:hypothetical protein